MIISCMNREATNDIKCWILSIPNNDNVVQYAGKGNSAELMKSKFLIKEMFVGMLDNIFSTT